MALTFLDKVWRDHEIAGLGGDYALLGIDRLVLHDMSAASILPQFLAAGRKPYAVSQIVCIADHMLDTRPSRPPGFARTAPMQEQLDVFRESVRKTDIAVFDVDDPRQGIVHVVTAETGLALPGMTLVCGDSHTSTLGGIGALAWGIGSSEAEHVLATQTLAQAKPKAMRVNFTGGLASGIYAKDLILALIGQEGAKGGIGFAAEFSGAAISSLSVEGRLTLCNMAIEFSAKYGFVPPDDTTIQYVSGREFAPKGAAFDFAAKYWRSLSSDEGAAFDRELTVDCSSLAPQVTWGTSPQHVTGVDAHVPDPATFADSETRKGMEAALRYQNLTPGTRMDALKIDAAYIGSCTNARIQDLREAAKIVKGKRVAAHVRAYCTPGSAAVKRAAEAEGLDRVFKDAGFEWHNSGCGLCAGGEGSWLEGLRVISTTNRNFENRQGRGTRTHLASPATVAASALAGHVADIRKLDA